MIGRLSSYAPLFSRELFPIIGSGLFILLSALIVVHTQWPFEIFSARLDQVTHFDGLAPGVDFTLIFAHLLYRYLDMSASKSVLAASLSALPFLGALILRTTTPLQGRWGPAIITSGHPITLALIFSGCGWAALGLFGLWRLLADLREKAPHQGMPLAGIGIGGAYLTVPQFGLYILPLAAVLFLCAPRHMLGRHMRVFYLLSFTPVVMMMGSYYYTASIFGGASPAPLADEGFAMSFIGLGVSLSLMAPGLFRHLTKTGGAARIAALSALLLTSTAPQTSPFLLLAAAGLAQMAINARFKEPPVWTAASIVGSGLVIILLDRPFFF